MRIMHHTFNLLVTLLLLVCAGTAGAEIILTTDQSEYMVGEIVHIAAYNAGPEDEQFNSFPFFQIYNTDTFECLFGCLGLPVMTDFPVGETVTMDWDTGDNPDPPGQYSVSMAVLFGGPTVSYLLTDVVPVVPESWGAVKALYR